MERKFIKKMKKTTLFLVLLLLILNSCLKDKAEAPFPYMSEVNSMRKNLGLRIIDSSFYLGNYSQKSLSTYDNINDNFGDVRLQPKEKPKNDKLHKIPHYWQKYIHLDKKTGELVYEEDIYRSGFYKTGVDETLYESLIYRYAYKEFYGYMYDNMDSIKISKGWQYVHQFPDTLNILTSSNIPNSKPKSYQLKQDEISESTADSILVSWDINRKSL